MSRLAIRQYIAGIPARMDYYRELIAREETLNREILALEEMARRDEDGVSISFAFGGHEFLYEIWFCREDEELVLQIDAYQAADRTRSNSQAFDVDEWAARMIFLTASPTRGNFQLMARVARAVINGRTVKIDSGTVSLDGFVSDQAEGGL